MIFLGVFLGVSLKASFVCSAITKTRPRQSRKSAEFSLAALGESLTNKMYGVLAKKTHAFVFIIELYSFFWASRKGLKEVKSIINRIVMWAAYAI